MKAFHGQVIASAVLAVACGRESVSSGKGVGPSVDSGNPPLEDSSDDMAQEIVPGVGIGPVALGGTYGVLKDAYGTPDTLTDYNRIFFATWLELGVEVVMGSASDDGLEDDAIVVSVGTRLAEGFTGVVIPGMGRAEADAVLGTCLDVIDDAHCYHPAGVYLGYDEAGLIKTVAVHPAYTPRPEPPEMMPALGLGGVR